MFCLSGIRQLNQKRTIRMKYFLKPPTHAVPFFSFLSNYYRYCSNALMLFFESVLTRPLNLCMRIALPQQLSITSSLSVIIQYYYSSSKKFYRLNIQDWVTNVILSHDSFGAEVGNCFPSQICNLYKPASFSFEGLFTNLRGGGGTPDRWGNMCRSPHLSCKRNKIKMRD